MQELIRRIALGSLSLTAGFLPGAAVAQEELGVDPETPAGSKIAARALAAAGLTPPGGLGSNVAWGSGLGWKWMSAGEFTPEANSLSARLRFHYSDGYYDPEGSHSGFYNAELRLDPGLQVLLLICPVRDVGASTDLDLEWVKYTVDTFDGNVEREFLDGIATQGVPGYTSLMLFAPPDEILRVWEPGSVLVRHVLRVYIGQDTTFAGCAVLYQRQVAPGPDTATFDDVPVSHPFFQYIEALVASGVTAGCDADSYCPGAPLTRGQMAVFLAKALGMGYPQ